MTTNVVSGLAQKNRAFLNRAKPQRIGRERVAGLAFDGVNDYITAPSINTLSFTETSNFTISTWFIANSFALTNGSNPRLFSKNNDVTNGYTTAVNATNTFLIFYNSGNSLVFSTSFNFQIGVLYNITFVKRSGISESNVDIYVNNVLQVTSVTGIATTFTSPFQIEIGRLGNFNGGYFNGSLFDVKVFNKNLSLFELRDLFFKRGDVPQNFANGSIVADYRLNNFQRLANAVAIDSSLNGNNGTLVNYTAGDLTAGSGCKIVDRFNNPIRS